MGSRVLDLSHLGVQNYLGESPSGRNTAFRLRCYALRYSAQGDCTSNHTTQRSSSQGCAEFDHISASHHHEASLPEPNFEFAETLRSGWRLARTRHHVGWATCGDRAVVQCQSQNTLTESEFHPFAQRRSTFTRESTSSCRQII